MPDDSDPKILADPNPIRWPLQVMIPLFCGAIVLLLAYRVYDQQISRVRRDEQQLYAQKAQKIAAAIEFSVRERVLIAEGLARFIALLPDFTDEQFAAYADELQKSESGIFSIALVQASGIQNVYPTLQDEDSSTVEQLLSFNQNAAVQTMTATDGPVLSGPLDLMPDKLAYVLRLPVLPDGSESSQSNAADDTRHIAMVVTLESLVSEVAADIPADLGINVQQISQGDSQNISLLGDAFPVGAAFVESPVGLPGVSWRLRLIPPRGWVTRLPDHNSRVLAAAVLSGFSAFISWLFLRFHLLRSEHLEQLQTAQQSMQLAQARLQLALIRGNIGLWDLHPLSGKIAYSGTFKSMLRDTGATEWTGTLKDWKSRLHPDDKASMTSTLLDFVDSDETQYQAEYRLLCDDGLYRWFRTEATGTGQRGTAEYRIMGVLIDVSKDRESRERLQDERLETQSILDSIPSLVILRDADDRILRVNEAVVRATGMDRETLKGKRVREVIPGSGQPEESQEQGIVRSPDLRSNDVRLLGDRWVQTQNVPITNSRGESDRTIIVSTDITELRRAEQSQEQASRFQMKVGELARIGGWDLDLVTNKLTWSDMVKQIHEVPADYEPDIATAVEFYPDEAKDEIQAVINKAISLETSWDVTLPLVTAKGRRVYVRAMGQPVFKDNRCVALWGVFQDVTKQHQETELRDALFRNGPNACFLFSEDGILECNPPAIKMLRANSRAELLEHHPAEFSPEFQACGTPSSEKCKVMDAAAKDKGVHQFEWLHRRMDGEVFPCEVTLSYIEMDSVPVLLAAWRDLSEEKEVARERDGFFALSLDLFCVIDQDGRFKRVNSAWRQVEGPAPENLPGVSVADLAIKDHRIATEQMLADLIKLGRVTEFRNKVKWKDGTERWLEWNALAASNEAKVFFAVARDVTDRIESVQQLSNLNAELQDANEALQQSNVDLQQFAYVASHDLQTPLRGIAGFAQMLVEDYADELDEDANNYLNRITSGTQRMQRLIQDLLQYSRIEIVGQDLQPVDLNLVISDILVLLETDIADKNARVTCDHLPTILGDSSQLFQLFTNVISNGIKYNTSEVPEVSIHVVTGSDSAEDKSKEHLEITVTDNGIGIEPEFQGQIFDVFRRLHTEREYSGTGIGLAICKRVMQRHEGEIWVTGKPGEGSCFHLRFSSYASEI